MQQTLKLSELVGEIEATIYNRFYGKTFWIKAEITDVKKQPDKRWCFLKFIEKNRDAITTEIKGVFWSEAYYNIEGFEKATHQVFASGIEITCCVRIRFHKRFGIDLEVLEIDFAYTIGKIEMERKQTLERLINENIAISLTNGNYVTKNNSFKLPVVFQRIALITAPNSDGQRDFKEVIFKNNYGYAFVVKEFLTQIQGDTASKMILNQLREIETCQEEFDFVVIVRGGGSDTDFRAFNEYELAKCVALFPIPVLTGIGHDRNTSIVDLMARQYKTPTEVAKFIIDNNFDFDNKIQGLKEQISTNIEYLLDNARNKLAEYTYRIKSANPETILKKGFAIIRSNGKIITDPKNIAINSEIQTFLKEEIIYSTVTQKQKYDKEPEL